MRFDKLSAVLLDHCFHQSTFDHSMFVHQFPCGTIVLIVYVDGIIIFGNKIEGICALKNYLGKQFHTENLGDLCYFLGVEVVRTSQEMAYENNDSVPWLSLMVGLEKGKAKVNDGSTSRSQGEKELYSKLWHACAGPLVNVPRTGDKVFYFLQGHIEQVQACAIQDIEAKMPAYNLPSKILCKVVSVELKTEIYSDEVFARVCLIPDIEGSSSKDVISRAVAQKISARFFSKRLTPSDTHTSGGFLVPEQIVDECFPALDISQESPAQELIAKDLHGSEWQFRHVCQGKRHLITNGWRKFMNAKKLVAGDNCVFLRGENNEIYVGVRRATKPHNSLSASILSGPSMQHGILAGAWRSICMRGISAVHYRPWNCPAEFLIPYEKYLMSAEYEYSIGTKFWMKMEENECMEQKCSRFVGTVVGIEDVDPIMWPGSEWRCLKVQWDAPPDTPVLPERVSPWEIEPIGKRKCLSILSDEKRARHLDPSGFGLPVIFRDGLLKGSVEHGPKSPLGVFQAQEIRAGSANVLGENRQLSVPYFLPHLNANWGARRQFGLGNQAPFNILTPGGNLPNPSSSNDWSPTLNGLVAHDKGMFFPKGKSPGSISPATIKVLEPSTSISDDHPDKQCKNRMSSLSTKVKLHGTTLGRSVQLARLNGYEDLIRELDMKFDFKGTLINGSRGCYVGYTDHEGDLVILGDRPWQEFLGLVRKLNIIPKELAKEFI